MDNIYERLNDFESSIDCAASFFPSHCIIKKSYFNSMVLNLYNLLPEELCAAKEHIMQISDDNVFTLLTQLNYIAENSKSFLGYIFIKKNNISYLIDKIYAALPDNIKEARGKQ